MRDIRVAVMGCGRWGKNLVRVIRDMEGATLAFLVDPDEKALDTAQDIAPGVRAISCVEATAYDFDAAVIATPAAAHEAHTAGLLKRGKHVLVEKPAALSTTGALRLSRLAGDHNAVLMVGHQLLFHSAFGSLLDCIETGAVGEIRRVVAVRTAAVDMIKEPGVIWSLGPHDVSMISCLFDGGPVRFGCRFSPNGSPLEATRADISLCFAGGARASVELYSAHENRIRDFRVYGTGGILYFDDAVPGGILTLETPDVGVRRLPLEQADVEPLAAECRHFFASILSGTTPRTGAEHICRVTSILDTCCKEAERSNGRSSELS